MLLRNARLIQTDRIVPRADVRVTDGKISDISEAELPELGNEELIDLGGRFLSPGFIDLHIHGALRRDTMEADPEAFRTTCKFHASGGTTALSLTTATATNEHILRVLQTAKAVRKEEPVGARILGVHIEGPYFAMNKRGAHDAALVRNPKREEYEQWLAYSDVITQMTLAPELPGSLELIETLTTAGIRASGGHSDATDEDAAAAHAHGMRKVTHTFNCMSTARREGIYRKAGLLEYALSEPEILCELIADTHHVSPTLMRMTYMAKGPDGIALITDAIGGAGLAEGERFKVAGLDCMVKDDVGILADGSALAGSVSTMNRMVRNMVQLVGVPLVEAVQMATLNPAHALGIEDRKGRIAVGADADLVVLDDKLDVLRTFVGGRTVFVRD
ncbi:N-acetylglucosamine-6-phosphate deacetylase [Verrucomicrobiota bacterium sgz303538]